MLYIINYIHQLAFWNCSRGSVRFADVSSERVPCVAWGATHPPTRKVASGLYRTCHLWIHEKDSNTRNDIFRTHPHDNRWSGGAFNGWMRLLVDRLATRQKRGRRETQLCRNRSALTFLSAGETREIAARAGHGAREEPSAQAAQPGPAEISQHITIGISQSNLTT